jgi:glycosyltransferase involved in cell wall biosynthesis
MLDLARDTDVAINLSGLLRDEALLEPVPIRAYVDLDPAFTQLWHVQDVDMGFALHTHFLTIGPAIAGSEPPVPTCGLSWIAARPPVVLDAWPSAGEIVWGGLTTIAHWRSYGSISHDGVHYGQKAHALRTLITLPALTDESFVLALRIDRGDEDDLAALERHGWQLLDPVEIAGTPAGYHAFVQGSKAEFGVAKTGYTVSQCGWFSDRSACYLASGRPVIAQETGFGRFLPVGEGLFSFETSDDVLAAIDELRSDDRRHSRAARAIAEEHFASDRVLTALLETVGASR